MDEDSVLVELDVTPRLLDDSVDELEVMPRLEELEDSVDEDDSVDEEEVMPRLDDEDSVDELEETPRLEELEDGSVEELEDGSVDEEEEETAKAILNDLHIFASWFELKLHCWLTVYEPLDDTIRSQTPIQSSLPAAVFCRNVALEPYSYPPFCPLYKQDTATMTSSSSTVLILSVSHDDVQLSVPPADSAL